jgi:hypothetical protein
MTVEEKNKPNHNGETISCLKLGIACRKYLVME